MKLQVVLNEEETEKWKTCGEDEDLFRSTARALLRQTITEIFVEVDVVNFERNQVLETILKKKPVTNKGLVKR